MSALGPRVTRRAMFRASAGAAAAWVASSAGAAEPAAAKTLVFVRLRGGADGLSLIVPYLSPGYYRARPRIAIEPPGKGPRSAVQLDAQFALHPCLARWQESFERKEFGAVLGVGLRSHVGSHRQAQRELDAAILRAAGTPVHDVLRGELGEQLQKVAAAIQPGTSRTVLLESLGWDTHMAQGTGTRGRLAVLAKELESALLAFRVAAALHWDQVRVAIVTEFGRTLSESPLHGTDDAYASVLFTFGGQHGGRVRGSYGSLEPGSPRDERASPPTLDLEGVLSRFVRGEELA